MTARGVPVDHTTIYRWGQKSPLSWTSKHGGTDTLPDWQASSWRADEIYIRVGGRWCYPYRAITAGGQTLDFLPLFEAERGRSGTFPGQGRQIKTTIKMTY